MFSRTNPHLSQPSDVPPHRQRVFSVKDHLSPSTDESKGGHETLTTGGEEGRRGRKEFHPVLVGGRRFRERKEGHLWTLKSHESDDL